MKKKMCLVLAAIMMTMLFAGCGSDKTELVERTPFPQFNEADTNGNVVTNAIFAGYDVTIVTFWNNGCETCIEQMPKLQEMYQNLKEQKINLIGVGADARESADQLGAAQRILKEKGVTYVNLAPNPANAFYKDFISQLSGYPSTYVVDKTGNIVGQVIVGNEKKQEKALQKRIDLVLSELSD